MKISLKSFLTYFLILYYTIPLLGSLLAYGFIINDFIQIIGYLTVILVMTPINILLFLGFFPPAWIVLAWYLFWKTKPVR